MTDIAIVLLIGVASMCIPAVGAVASEISHQRKLKRMAQAQRNVAEMLGRVAK